MISTVPYSSIPFSAYIVFYTVISGPGPDPEPAVPPAPSDRQRVLDTIKKTFTAHNTQQTNLNAIWRRNDGSVADFLKD
jgi:hypothetical protein